MTQPYKVCPQCSQPAVLEMPQCRRCGFLYRASPQISMASSNLASHPPERSRAERNRVRNRMLFGMLGVLLLLVGVAAGLIRLFSTASARPESGLTQVPQQTLPSRQPSLPTAPAIGMPDSSLPSHPGMFIEKDSPREIPTLHVTNEERDTLLLTLWDRQGHVYTLTGPGRQTATLTIPPGEYQLSIVSQLPHAQPNYGDAIFRRRKEYYASFHHTGFTTPIHLGDQ
jgi:hypothetical protein